MADSKRAASRHSAVPVKVGKLKKIADDTDNAGMTCVAGPVVVCRKYKCIPKPCLILFSTKLSNKLQIY